MTERATTTASLRERTKAAMRDEVAAVAIKLFAEHGFDAVTTTQIAAVAGISPRSFFRYFPTKEDLVLGGLQDAGHRVQAALRSRPSREGPWTALRHALRVLMDEPVYPPQHLQTITRIILETPSIRARDMQKHQQWEELLAPEIARRMSNPDRAGLSDSDARARALIGAALSCLRVATDTWLRSGGTADPIAILDELIDTVRTA
ncbi:TetR family transcriptional regulator [Dactylosporangium sp. CA-092794]|uniref:TetR family transcriptional regulator n=1 Tax=Dactylosporangium sp. CA-092794 TaxID=3239929 RepID=UPI003D8DD8B3